LDTAEAISTMAYLCYSSSYIRSLKIVQEGGIKLIRGQMHLFLRANTGSFKSTILRELAGYFKVGTIELITNAGLVGTIDKNMNVIPGEAWRIRNKLLLLDEFNIEGDSSCVAPLLSLLEDQHYKKAIGRMANEQKEADNDLFFEVKKGEMHVRTRFSCVICSMRKIQKNRSVNIEALLSRCVVVPYSLNDNEIEHVMNGHSLLTIKKCPFKKPFDVTIKAKDYKQILKSVKGYPGLDIQKQYARTVGDCCRAFAVLGKHDEQVYFLITKLHQES
jgi:hypothetical protein